MVDQARAEVTLTDLTGKKFPQPWTVEVVDLTVVDRLGFTGDTATLTFDRAPDDGGAWAVDNILDFPSSTRTDIALGVEGGPPMVEHGPYYVRRASSVTMESGIAFSVSLSRASASRTLETILRTTMFRQIAWLTGIDLTASTVERLGETRGYGGLVDELAALGYGVSLVRLNLRNLVQLVGRGLPGALDGSQAARFFAGWAGTPVPFIYEISRLVILRAPTEDPDTHGVDLFDRTVVLDVSEYDLNIQVGDLRRSNNPVDNVRSIRYSVLGSDELGRSVLTEDDAGPLGSRSSVPLEPSVEAIDQLPVTVLSGEYSDGEDARDAVVGKAVQQSLEAISASVEIDWNPDLVNGSLVTHDGLIFRVIEIAHNLQKVSTALTMVPVITS